MGCEMKLDEFYDFIVFTSASVAYFMRVLLVRVIPMNDII
jgi:hypothetical protein